MRTFVTSVRLKDAETADYERLDREMEKERFAKAGFSGGAFQQRGERVSQYNYLGGLSLQDVTAAAYRAAHKTGKPYSFTVIKQRS